MKQHKKAVKWEVFGWILFLGVLAFLIVGQAKLNSAFAKTSNFVKSFIPGANVPEFSGSSPVPEDVSSFYNNMVDSVKSANDDDCLISLELIPEKFKNYKVALSNKEGKILRKDSSNTYVPYDPKEMQNFQPCLIEGKFAVGFYECTVLNKKESCASMVSNRNFEIEDRSYMPYIYKSGNSFCFIKTYDDFGSGCDAPKKEGAEGIDNDCISSIKTRKCEGKLLVPDIPTGVTSIGIFNRFSSFMRSPERQLKDSSISSCYLDFNLADLEKGSYISVEKNKIFLKKYENGISVYVNTIPFELPKPVPYLSVENIFILNQENYNALIEEFINYAISPEGEIYKDNNQIYPFSMLSLNTATLVYKNGFWALTKATPLDRNRYNIGPRCEFTE